LANSESSFASFRKRSALLTGPCKVNTRFHPRPTGIGGEGKDSNLPIRFPVLRTKRVRCFRPLGHLSPSPHHQPRLQNVEQHAHPHTPLIWGGDDMFRGDAAAGYYKVAITAPDLQLQASEFRRFRLARRFRMRSRRARARRLRRKCLDGQSSALLASSAEMAKAVVGTGPTNRRTDVVSKPHAFLVEVMSCRSAAFSVRWGSVSQLRLLARGHRGVFASCRHGVIAPDRRVRNSLFDLVVKIRPA
jgi:hypothetical protein